jgi:flagellar hook-length control protein FliK
MSLDLSALLPTPAMSNLPAAVSPGASASDADVEAAATPFAGVLGDLLGTAPAPTPTLPSGAAAPALLALSPELNRMPAPFGTDLDGAVDAAVDVPGAAAPAASPVLLEGVVPAPAAPTAVLNTQGSFNARIASPPPSQIKAQAEAAAAAAAAPTLADTPVIPASLTRLLESAAAASLPEVSVPEAATPEADVAELPEASPALPMPTLLAMPAPAPLPQALTLDGGSTAEAAPLAPHPAGSLVAPADFDTPVEARPDAGLEPDVAADPQGAAMAEASQAKAPSLTQAAPVDASAPAAAAPTPVDSAKADPLAPLTALSNSAPPPPSVQPMARPEVQAHQHSLRFGTGQDVAGHVAVHVAKGAAEGKTDFVIRLDPPELGRIDIKLEMSHDGRVQAVLAADSAPVVDLLRRDAAALERAFADAGLKTDSGSLSFNLRQQQEQGQPGQHSRSGGQADSSGYADAADADPQPITATSTRWVRSADGVELLV